MLQEVRAFMKQESLRGSITLGTLLDELDEADMEDLADEVELTASELGLSDMVRVNTFLSRAAAAEEAEGDDDTDDSDETE